ncbi:MAG TPA: acylphosphatase [Thermoleophilia bacterium]|nr:acylphosphatase [Thermoleophilia bacterium]
MTGHDTRALKAVRFRVEGRVQGVGYRYSAQRVGAQLGLQGWVRNRADGAVEGHVQGDGHTVDAMLDWLREGPSHARVDALTSDPVPVDTTLAGFGIRP